MAMEIAILAAIFGGPALLTLFAYKWHAGIEERFRRKKREEFPKIVED